MKNIKDHKPQGAAKASAAISRRGFLGTTAAAGAVSLSNVALGGRRGSDRGRDVLVNVFLRGGLDGLSAVVPYGDSDLYVARPSLAIDPPGQVGGALNLDGFFGLNPACAPLLNAYQQGDLAIIHATGSTDPSRSHFSAQYLMETGTPNLSYLGLTDGWLARHLKSVTPIGRGDLRALGLKPVLPRSLVGAPGTLPVANPADLDFPGSPGLAAAYRNILETSYGVAAEPLNGAASAGLSAIDTLGAIDFDNYQPGNGAAYPQGGFGNALTSAAAMIKADIGLECLQIDINGWDHHSGQGPQNGLLATMLDDFSQGLDAFYRDMQAELGRVTLVVMTEFGRRVAENGSAGTDHGHGGVMFVLGGNVNGGQVFSQWPGLDPASLGNGDLPITTDYRDVLAEILQLRLGNASVRDVFPQHTPQFRGVVA